jgi:hypothetical protein
VMTTMLAPLISALLQPDVFTQPLPATTKMPALWILVTPALVASSQTKPAQTRIPAQLTLAIPPQVAFLNC